MVKRTMSLLIAVCFLLVGIGAFAQPVDPGEPIDPLTSKQKLVMQQKVKELKAQVEAMNTKLVKARKGQNLTSLIDEFLIGQFRTSFNSLSKEINSAKMQNKSSQTLIKLSDTANRGKIILNNFESRVGANNKSAALGQLSDMSKVLNNMQSVLQGDQPEYMR